MRYEVMLPHQIRHAIEENWPVVLPAGVLEFHAEHLAVGTDTVPLVRMLELLEKEMNLVILPPFYYGAASYAVKGPEGSGTIHVDADAIAPFARQLFRSCLRIGFRNMHIFLAHQTENFVAGMPTDLAFKFAARQEIFAFLEKEHGEGWWGGKGMEDYYQKHAQGGNPFNWIQVHPLTATGLRKELQGGGHADIIETSMMMALCPEGVDMKHFSDEFWYAKTATQASATIGREITEACLADLRKVLNGATGQGAANG